MLYQLSIGTVVIFFSIVVQVLFVAVAIHVLSKNGQWFIRPPMLFKTVVSLVAVVLWLILGISINAWSWALLFISLDVIHDLESALYFSIVTFTTLGYGDITVTKEWRILASFAAVNGLIIFGLNTAFLVEFANKLRNAQERNRTNDKEPP